MELLHSAFFLYFPKAEIMKLDNVGALAYHRSVYVPECSLLTIKDLSFNLVSLLVHSVNIITMNNK